jgi:ubiquinone/menaquinone biosynthesis C-methylase UbiE
MTEKFVPEEYTNPDAVPDAGHGDNSDTEPEKGHRFGPTFFQKILNKLAEIPIADRLGVKRAVTLVEKSQIEKHLKNGGVYLDIGSGLGHIVEEMVKEKGEKKISMLAIEPTWEPLRRVHTRVKKESDNRALFAKGEALHLPVKDNSLDGVSIFFVLHHMPQEALEGVFAEVKRVLKEDGKIFLVEDTPKNEDEYARNEKWDRRLNFEGKGEEHYYKSPAEWVEFLTQNGFELVEQVDFSSQSSKKDEGKINHTNFILRKSKKE